jgi:hypothetical protein
MEYAGWTTLPLWSTSFLQLLAKLDDEQRQDVLRIMEAFVQSSK